DDLTRLHDGRLWVRLACLDAAGEPLAGWVSVMRFSISQADATAEGLEQLMIQLERLGAEADAPRRQQAAQRNQPEDTSCRSATPNWLNWNGPCGERTSRGRGG